ncbi:MAG: hypothetical protein ACRCWJ_18850 [Casimicrobium sp.]
MAKISENAPIAVTLAYLRCPLHCHHHGHHHHHHLRHHHRD